MVDLPTVAIPLKTLLFLIRLFLHTRKGVESTNDIPVQFPIQHDLRNRVIGI